MTDKRRLETQLEDLAASYFKPDEPGASIIVMRDGQPLLRTGYGLANIELGVRIQPEMVFRLGSITKQFTGVAILMLQERGQLSLQYPIERLLTHTVGIKSYCFCTRRALCAVCRGRTHPSLICAFANRILLERLIDPAALCDGRHV